MKPTPSTTVVAFDARYINDKYHGIGRHAYNLLDILTRMDTDRRYLAYYHPEYLNTRFDLSHLQQRPNLEFRPVHLPLYSPREPLAWPGLLVRDGVDIFHSPYVLLPLLAPVKSIMTVHDLIFERYPAYRPRGVLQRFYQPVTRLGLQKARAVLTVSEATAVDMQAFYHVAEKRIRVIGNAIDPLFRPEHDAQKIAEVRARYNLPQHFILTVGAGRPHKNVEVLVDAFAHLVEWPEMKLVAVGELDTRFPDSVGARIATYDIADRVLRPGMIRESDLPVVYGLADIFVFPSLIEGFGLPPLEAMACGTPVVTSDTPAIAEVVADAALTFDGRNARQLAAILHMLLTDVRLQSALRERGLKRASTFSWERVGRETLNAYDLLEADRSRKAKVWDKAREPIAYESI
jgi:glycosyltransferase involved in cell wall biosynthesis